MTKKKTQTTNETARVVLAMLLLSSFLYCVFIPSKEVVKSPELIALEAEFGEKPDRFESIGYVDVVASYLMRNINDPNSLEMRGCTKITNTTSGWYVGCNWSARNGFGGMVKAASWFVIRDSKVLAMIDAD